VRIGFDQVCLGEEADVVVVDAVLAEMQSHSGPLQAMQRVADQVVAYVDGAQGALIGLDDGEGGVIYSCASGLYRPWAGLRVPIQDSISGLCMQENAVLMSEDTEVDPRVDREACRQIGSRSVVVVPIRRAGEAVGVMSVCSSVPQAFDAEQASVLSEVTEFVSAVVVASAELATTTARLLERSTDGEQAGGEGLGGARAKPIEEFVSSVLSPVAREHREHREQVEGILSERRIEAYFQPIVDIRNGSIFGVEALARFWEDPYMAPDRWFARAEAVGLGLDLEVLAIEVALERLVDLAAGVRMTVNASPATVLSPRLLEVMRATPEAHRVTIEVTEHAGVDDYRALEAAQGLLRQTGVSLAVDDTGAGIASLSHILELGPEFIKLDRALVTNVDRDPARYALVSSLVEFASRTGARIVAEGIEREPELETLRELGVDLGQGFHLHMPRPFAELPDDAVARRDPGTTDGQAKSPRA
jgi:EAL domain-containing protein (putative c-di-GMP-specific phosphodiesterase class I)